MKSPKELRKTNKFLSNCFEIVNIHNFLMANNVENGKEFSISGYFLFWGRGGGEFYLDHIDDNFKLQKNTKNMKMTPQKICF